MRFRVDPRKVHEVVMRDGTTYRPSPDGWVGVAARHEDEMSKSGARHDYYEAQIGTQSLVFAGGTGRPCGSCGFNAWAWSSTCGRCGTSLLDTSCPVEPVG